LTRTLTVEYIVLIAFKTSREGTLVVISQKCNKFYIFAFDRRCRLMMIDKVTMSYVVLLLIVDDWPIC